MNDKLRDEARSELEMFGRFGAETCRELVKSWEHEPKHETVEQWEARTGETYPDSGPVYHWFEGNSRIDKCWLLCHYVYHKDLFPNRPVVVANHHGKPEDV